MWAIHVRKKFSETTLVSRKVAAQWLFSAGLYFQRKGIEDFVCCWKKMPHVCFIWLGGSISKWLIPKKIRDIVTASTLIMSASQVTKGSCLRWAMSGATPSFPSHEETEVVEIVVLEASPGSIWFCVIFCLSEGWVDDNSPHLGIMWTKFVVSCKILCRWQ